MCPWACWTSWLKKKKIKTNEQGKQNKNKLTEIRNKLMVARGEGRGGTGEKDEGDYSQ